MSDTDVVVEVYSGYRYGERPRAFTWQGRRYRVLSIEERWRSPRGFGFVVAAERQSDAGSASEHLDPNGGGHPPELWELIYDEALDVWHARSADIIED